MIVRESITLACLGIALGLVGAYGSGRLVATMLFGVSAMDPITNGSAGLILIVTAVLAALLPAFRASRIEPLNALRTE